MAGTEKKAGYFFNPKTLVEDKEPSSTARPSAEIHSPAEAQEVTKKRLREARGDE